MDNYIYRDRKMMKWIPFNALMEQSDYLSDLLHGRTRIEKPILSPDQEEELNYNLEMACIFKNEILVSYFENGEIKELNGVIDKVDPFHKTITISDIDLSAFTITNISFI